jgi:hypothetical protein
MRHLIDQCEQVRRCDRVEPRTSGAGKLRESRSQENRQHQQEDPDPLHTGRRCERAPQCPAEQGDQDERRHRRYQHQHYPRL